MRHLSLQTQVRNALALVDASSDRNSSIADALNWQAIRFRITVHAAASSATCTYSLYGGNASDMSDEVAVPQCERTIGDTDDGLTFELDEVALTKRYYRVKCNKNGVNNVQDSGTYELYGPKLTNPTDIAGEIATVRTYAEQGVYAYS